MRKLRYATSFYLAGTSGVVASNVLAANGLYDPEITGTGHQPMGFDQMMLSYNHYAVTSAKLTVTFHNFAASTPVVSLLVAAGSTPSTVVETILEYGLNNHSALEAKSTFGSVKTMDAFVSIKKFEGVKDIADVTDLKGSVAANPVELTYFHVQCWDNAGVTTNILCEVIMEFSAMFLEPRVLTPSLSSELKGLILREQEDQDDSKHCLTGVEFKATPLVPSREVPALAVRRAPMCEDALLEEIRHIDDPQEVIRICMRNAQEWAIYNNDNNTLQPPRTLRQSSATTCPQRTGIG